MWCWRCCRTARYINVVKSIAWKELTSFQARESLYSISITRLYDIVMVSCMMFYLDLLMYCRRLLAKCKWIIYVNKKVNTLKSYTHTQYSYYYILVCVFVWHGYYYHAGRSLLFGKQINWAVTKYQLKARHHKHFFWSIPLFLLLFWSHVSRFLHKSTK